MKFVACGVFAVLLLAGCAGAPPPAKSDDAQPASFEDLEVEATATTGILIGVVVDEAIRPLAGATVGITGTASDILEQITDDQGRFAFDELEPGTYFISARLLNYADAQAAVEVVAGDDEPPAVRVQLTRLFSQDPFMDMIKFDGFLQCAYAFGVSSTCVNDYTRVVGCLSPAACVCPGGCFRDQNLAAAGGNKREYVSSVSAGWQSIIWEETWKPTSEAGKTLGFTVSYFDRPTASHWFGSSNGADPIRLQILVGEKHSGANTQAGTPEMIPAEGYDQVFTFFGAGTNSLVLNQAFSAFESHFYYGLPPEGWSFVKGDKPPF